MVEIVKMKDYDEDDNNVRRLFRTKRIAKLIFKGRLIRSEVSERSINQRRRQRWTMLTLASCLIYARALLEYVIFIMWLRSVIKMSVKFAKDKVLTFLILREKC